MTSPSANEIETPEKARAKGKKLHTWWAVVSACWVLLMLNMSYSDLKYSLEYHLYRDRVEAEYQAEVTEYERKIQDGQERIRRLLQAAHQYEQLQFLSLAAKRSGRVASAARDAGNIGAPARPQSEYERMLEDMATLEKNYGKATLRKYRGSDGEMVQALNAEMRENLIVPQLRQPRLAAILFHMLASPLALLLALWIYLKGYRRLNRFLQIFPVRRT